MFAVAAAPAAPSDRFSPVLLVLMATVFVNMLGFGIVAPLLPFFARAMHAHAWQITLMFSAYSLGQFFGEPFWGRLSDRIGRRPVLIATSAANVIGYAALAFVPDVWGAILVRLLTGFGAGNVSTIQGFIADVTPPERRAGRMGLVSAAFGLGFIVGPALGGLLARPDAGALGYQPPLFAASTLAALSILGVFLFLSESRERAGAHAPPPPSPLASFGEARAHPVVSRGLLVSLIYMGGFSAMESAFGLWSQARFGWGAKEVGLCFMAIGLVSCTSQALLTGRLARRFGEARVLTMGVLAFGVSMAALTVLRAPELVPAALAIGAFGMAISMPNLNAMISQSSPPGRQGSMLGLNMAAGSAARIVGPMAAGAVFSGLGPNWPFWISAALCVPAAAVAVNAGRAMKRWRTLSTPAPIAHAAE